MAKATATIVVLRKKGVSIAQIRLQKKTAIAMCKERERGGAEGEGAVRGRDRETAKEIWSRSTDRG